MNTLIIILFLVIILFIIFNLTKNNNYIKEEYQYFPQNYQQNYQQNYLEYINTYTPTVCDPYYQPCRQNWIYQQNYYIPI